jgi:hypothetical protein
VVPGGNANVFARALGLPDTAIEATGHLLGALRDGRRRAVGLATADDRWFTFCAGLGPRRRGRAPRRGPARRRPQGDPGPVRRPGRPALLPRAQRKEPAITVQVGDGEPERVGLALVCNTTPWTYLGARPVQPCPEASFETGLDLFGIRRLRTTATLRHLRQILSRDPKLRGRDLLRLHDVPSWSCAATGRWPCRSTATTSATARRSSSAPSRAPSTSSSSRHAPTGRTRRGREE